MLKLSSNLKALMKASHINESELARRTGVSQPVIHRMANGESDNPQLGSLRPLARFFKTSIDQLIGDSPLSHEQRTAVYAANQLSVIPFLTFDQIKTWLKKTDNFIIDQEIVTDITVSKMSYCVELAGKMMEPLFPEKALLIIDPELNYQNYDFVIAYQHSQKQTLFRQLLISENETFLKPLNPDYPIIAMSAKDQILGTLAQVRINLK